MTWTLTEIISMGCGAVGVPFDEANFRFGTLEPSFNGQQHSHYLRTVLKALRPGLARSGRAERSASCP
jgi:hypothetical protein